jgi:hypothetical protein
MKTDMNDLTTRLRDLSGDFQGAMGEAIDRLAHEGRGQLRSAVGAPDTGTVVAAFFAGAILGAVVGGLVALLMAPKSGSQLREELTQRTRTNGMKRERAESPLA